MISSEVLCWECSDPLAAQEMRKRDAKKLKPRRRKSYLKRDYGCVWVRLARDEVAKAVRALRSIQLAARKAAADLDIKQATLEIGIANGHLRDCGDHVEPITEVGRQELQSLQEWLTQRAHEGGYGWVRSFFHVAHKRLAARALCAKALRDLDNCTSAQKHPRGERALRRAVTILRFLDSTDKMPEAC